MISPVSKIYPSAPVYPLRPEDSGAPGRELVIREYEPLPAERTKDNMLGMLGAYVLTPENSPNLWEEELAEKRFDAEYARAKVYAMIGLQLQVTLYLGGTIAISLNVNVASDC